MKQRFSSLDVRVIASELSLALTTLRIHNIYDLSSRIFLFKFAQPGKREQVLIDSGFRCHLTNFSRTASTYPSAFVQKLRKYLKSRRVTGVQQVGTDRVIEVVFSEGQYRLYLEFFAAGNIVLTDAEYNVLALLRQVSEGDEDVDVKVGGKYKIEAKQNYGGVPPVTEERARAALQKAEQRTKEAQEVGGKKAKRAKGGDDLRKALSAGFPEYPAHLLEHVFVETDVDAKWTIREVLDTPERMQRVMKALSKASEVYKTLEDGERKGYIIANEREDHWQTEKMQSGNSTVPPREALLYDDFHPFRPSQFANKRATYILEFDGFNRTVDEFYSSIESQKLESRLSEREQQAERKLQTAKNEHAKRLGALQHVQELHIRKAQAIEANTHRVEEASAAVNGLIGQGMDWVDIGKLIQNEQGRSNVVAQMVKLPLKLEENTVTLLLDEATFEQDEDEGYGSDRTDSDVDSEDDDAFSKKSEPAEKRLAVDIDLALSPWQNARQYYDQRKQAHVKEQKTMQASTRALKSTEKKIQDDLKKGLKQEKAVLRPSRRQFFFEKFFWFISSDGYLVLGGKDAQQNELLYRRYLKKGDIYVHADLQGAASVVVKNNPQTPDAPIPPSTLSQAGTLAVCTSSAWDSKAVMAAWWVNAEQVSKTAETGEYLQTGGFMVRGKKNFLPPSQLLLGFGVAWLISEESRANHGKHRLDRKDTVDGEVDAVADGTSQIDLNEGEDVDEASGDAVPDIEDTADEAEQEVEDDAVAGGATDRGEVDNDDHNENGAENDNDEHDNGERGQDANNYHNNPLQSTDLQQDVQDTDGSHDDTEEAEDDETHSYASPDDEKNDPDNASTTASTRPDTPASSGPSTTKPQPQSQSQSHKPLPRGKRAKQKRALKKYAEQSDDDRALAMTLLGSAKAQEKKAAAAETEEQRKAKVEADRERRRRQHQKAAEREKGRMERIGAGQTADGQSTVGDGTGPGAAIEESIDPDVLAQEASDHISIDLLVPAPEPGDEVLAAVPVVAPWTAMARSKYKVKLQPGGMKKGKAVKEIMGMWTGLGAKGRKVLDESNSDRERAWSKEVEMIKGWRVEEVVGSVPVKGCRVVQGGGLLGVVGGGGGGKGGGKATGGKGKSGGGGGGKTGKKGR